MSYKYPSASETKNRELVPINNAPNIEEGSV